MASKSSKGSGGPGSHSTYTFDSSSTESLTKAVKTVLQGMERTNAEMELANDLAATLASTTRAFSEDVNDYASGLRKGSVFKSEILSIERRLNKEAQSNFELSRKTRELEKRNLRLLRVRNDIEREIRLAKIDLSDEQIKETKEYAKARADADQQMQNAIASRMKARELEAKGMSKQAKKQLEHSKQEEEDASAAQKDAADLFNQLKEGQKELGLMLVARTVADTIIEKNEKYLRLQKEINKVTGITGELLEGVNRIGVRILGGIGINLGVISSAFNEGKEAMEDFALEVAKKRIDQDINTPFARTRALAKGIGAFLGELPGLISDPVSVLAVLFSNMNEVNRQFVEFSRITGQTVNPFDSLNRDMVTTVQYMETLNALSNKFSMNVSEVFTEETIAKAAELRNTFGLTVEEAGQLATLSNLNNKSVDFTLDTITQQVNQFNRINRTSINHGNVLKEVSQTSDDILAIFSRKPEELTKAVAVSKRLGVELKTLESIAESLLNFETSIENELQAQLLTGQEINLAKAREAALSNDLATVGEEIFSNTVDLSRYAQMNRISQQGLADALGLSRDQLGKIAMQRAMELEFTSEALEKATNLTKEDMLRLAAMDQLNLAIQKIGQALSIPAGYFASILNTSTGLYVTLGVIGAFLVGKLIVSIKNMYIQLFGSKAATDTLNKSLTKTNALLATANAQTKSLATNLTIAGAAASSTWTTTSTAAGFAAPTVAGAAAGTSAAGAARAAGAAGAAGKVLGGMSMAVFGKVILATLAIGGVAYGIYKLFSKNEDKNKRKTIRVNDALYTNDGRIIKPNSRDHTLFFQDFSKYAGASKRSFNSNASNDNNERTLKEMSDTLKVIAQKDYNLHLNYERMTTTASKSDFKQNA